MCERESERTGNDHGVAWLFMYPDEICMFDVDCEHKKHHHKVTIPGQEV